MMTGEIAPLGSRYVVTLNAEDCVSGASLARQQVEADSKEEVLAAVGGAAKRMRRELGESLASIERFDAPIEQATTGSLEALKVFSRAEEIRATEGDGAALPLYRRAVELDPDFAVALGRLGSIYGNLSEPELAADYKRRAFELRDRVSELERLYLTSHYYFTVTGELDKLTETYELWRDTYPRDWRPYNNLGVVHTLTGRYERSAAAAREAMRLEPDHVFPYSVLGWSLVQLGRAAKAEGVFQAALDRGLDEIDIRVGLFWVAYLKGDQAGIRQQLEAWSGKPAEHRLLELEAEARASAGRLAEAREIGRRAIALAQRQQFTESAALMTARGAATDAAFGPWGAGSHRRPRGSRDRSQPRHYGDRGGGSSPHRRRPRNRRADR